MAVSTILVRVGVVNTIRIDSGDTDSDILDLITDNRRLNALLILGPSALTDTVTAEVSLDDGATWVTLQSAGADLAVPAAAGTVITDVPPCLFRVNSAGAEGADRDFQVIAIPATGV